MREAAEKWERAAEKGREAGNTALVAGAIGQQALLQAFALDVPAAEAMGAEALALARESGSMRALAHAHCAMARVRELQDRLEEALEHGREWLEIARETSGTLEEVAASVFGLAEPLIGLNHPREARTYLERAGALSANVGGTAYDTNVNYNSVRVLLMLGEIEAAESYVDRLEQAPEFSVYWDATADWAKAASLLNEVRALPNDRPEKTLRKGLADSRQERTSDWAEVDAALRLGEILIKKGQFDETKSVADRIRSKLEGSGATRLERRLSALESLLQEQQ